MNKNLCTIELLLFELLYDYCFRTIYLSLNALQFLETNNYEQTENISALKLKFKEI